MNDPTDPFSLPLEWVPKRHRRLLAAIRAWADDQVLEARLPRPAEVTLVRDGVPVVQLHGDRLDHPVEGPGVYRLEARLHAHGARRTWILSNPVYLR